MKALVTGATGLIGRRLVARLNEPRVVARDVGAAKSALGVHDVVEWASGRAFPTEALDGIDTVFHLAGEPLAAGRLTTERKLRVRDSRILGTRAVVEAVRANRHRPRALVSASAIGFYGTRGDEVLTEQSAAGSGFLADVCRDWEAEAGGASALGVRTVLVRTGIVLAPDGGALAAMRPAFQLGVGGPLGTGLHWMSWIHVDDVVGLLLHAAEQSVVEGPMNVCAPDPIRNRDFVRAFGRALHRPAWFSTPVSVLRLATGEMADVIVASQRVIPAKAIESGYSFRFRSVEDALREAVASQS